ncbi:unnamed protein product [Ilex paraguariensis]|uniref:Transmembrane protein n=1 Tax=Ilex paraguariensis TaxID=185542 RepID=A0ABC8TBT9_9AQUA
MDESKHQNLQSLTQFMTSHISKKFSQLLLSISIFSLLFVYSSWYSFLLPSIKFYVSTFPVQLVSHTLHKNCIFLICNGILVFLVKTSGLVLSPSGFDLNDLILNKVGDGLQVSPEGIKESLLEKESLVETENAGSEENEEGGGGGGEHFIEEKRESLNLIVEHEAQEAESESSLIVREAVDGGERKEENITFYIEEEETEKEPLNESNAGGGKEGNELLSTEELNKKFDDFIRRVKEEIRFKAQQPLVMVNN